MPNFQIMKKWSLLHFGKGATQSLCHACLLVLSVLNYAFLTVINSNSSSFDFIEVIYSVLIIVNPCGLLSFQEITTQSDIAIWKMIYKISQ